MGEEYAWHYFFSMNIPHSVLKILISTQRYWRSLLRILPQLRPCMYLKRNQVCKSMSSYMKIHFSDKFCRAIECNEFEISAKGRMPVRSTYILDNKRKCLIVRQDVGLRLIQEKKNEVEAQMWLQVLSAIS